MTKTEKTALKIGALVALLVAVAVIAYKSGATGSLNIIGLWR
jgi:hypothetical protein